MGDYGALSLLPPALCIALVIYTRNIIISLVFGALSGSFILSGYNPFFAVSNLMEKHIFQELAVSANVQVLVAIFAIGGFVQLLDKSGGAKAFSTIIVKTISTPKKAQMSAWIAGISVFFTDVGNALIIAPLYRPVFHRLKICREKLAFIVDTTAAPVCILVPFVGWGVYIMGLIDNSYADIGLTENSFTVLLNAWPYQFYALLALSSVPMILVTGKDFGPMARAQTAFNKNLKDGTLDEGEEEKEKQEQSKVDIGNQSEVPMSMVYLPLLVMFVTMTVYITYFALEEGMKSVHVRGALSVSYIFAAIVCAFLMKRHKKTLYKNSINHFVRGLEKMVLICLILTLAWAFSSVIKDLHTGYYLATLIGDSIDPHFLPLIVFFLGAIMSFSTGSSYGTFAILMIIVIPVAHQLGAPMVLTIAAILSGGLFGDHTSPISDTTVLASMGAGCPHVNHVATQFPYALLTGFMAMLAFIITGFYQSPYIVIFMIAVQFFVINLIMKTYGQDSRG